MHIQNRIILITGASSGIGAATAIALAKKGAKVVLAARGEEALGSVAATIRANVGVAHVYAGDLTNASVTESLYRRIVAEVGHPEIVINSAGAGRWLFTEETSPEEMVQMMGAPYFAAFYITRLCLPEMLRRKQGQIVNVNSPVVHGAWPGAAGYTAARYAMYGFTKALRLDLTGTGVQAISIIPGKTTSEYFDRNPGAYERLPKVGVLIPDVSPQQVADAIVDAIEHDRREVVLPFMLNLFFIFNHFFPWMVEWLILKTGWTHDRTDRDKTTQ
jgi:uncharacterized protein